MGTPLASRTPPRKRVSKRLVLGLIIGAVVMGSLLAVFLPVIPRAFSGSVIEYGCEGGGPCSIPSESPSLHSFPLGSRVQFSWQTEGALAVSLYVADVSGNVVSSCSQRGETGSCAFDSNGWNYEFHFDWNGTLAIAVVEFNGTFTAPLL